MFEINIQITNIFIEHRTHTNELERHENPDGKQGKRPDGRIKEIV